MSNSFIESIKTMVNSTINKAGYDKTRTGQIVRVHTDTNTYDIQIDGWVYPNVGVVNDMSYNVYDVVKVVMPCNQATQMYITSSVLSDNSMGKKVAYATTIAEMAEGFITTATKTYYQADPPVGENVGDSWYSTTEQNKLYVWDGLQWVVGQDSAQAYDIAADTEKYFWISDSAIIGIGVLVTQKTQTEFLANPINGGMNMLIHSNEIILRNGLTNLLIIDTNGNLQPLGNIVNLYKVTDYQVDIASINANSNIDITNYSISRENGYQAIGIIGYVPSDYNIRLATNYITDNIIGNPVLTVDFVNESSNILTNQNVVFKILWIKAMA